MPSNNKRPSWWRELTDDEYKSMALSMVVSSFDARNAVSIVVSGKPLLETPNEEYKIRSMQPFADHLESEIRDAASMADRASPPADFIAVYSTRAYGLETMKAAVAGLGWIDVVTTYLREKDAPVAPIVDTVKNLPEGASLEMLQEALIEALKQGLALPQTYSNKAIIAITFDIWLNNLLGKNYYDQVAIKASDLGERSWQVRSLSMMPAQTIDRAARGPRSWFHPPNDAPIFQDANNAHVVTYFEDGMTQKALREGVMQLNPRTADVWRLCTATILESWARSQQEPPKVWIDARQLCDAMGFKKHHKGGHRPENIALATRALLDLERFHIIIPAGTKQYPADQNGNQKAVTLQARVQHRVLAVLAKEEIKPESNNSNEWVSLRWLMTAGEWIKAYPRTQFAPLFRALVELPGTYTPDLWAKAIGTELVWQYRQDKGKVKTQLVETMLRQACVLEEARHVQNKGRVRNNFEKALDILKEHGVCEAWEYKDTDIDLVDLNTKPRGWFDLWLRARVVVTPPAEITKMISGITKSKKQNFRSIQKA